MKNIFQASEGCFDQDPQDSVLWLGRQTVEGAAGHKCYF